MLKQLKKIFSSKPKQEKSESLYTALATSEHSSFWKKITSILSSRKKVDEEVLEELEELLLSADISFTTTSKILAKFNNIYSKNNQEKLSAEGGDDVIKRIVFESALSLFGAAEITHTPKMWEEKPHIIFVVGVNGVGKTTTIAKLAYSFKESGMGVMLGAGDTFRAGAIDQLSIWAERIGIPIVKKERKSDPSSVVYDTIKSAIAKQIDAVIMDTSGRLHNNDDLMNELKKMVTTSDKIRQGSPHEIYLVIDGTSGQNALEQAKKFKEIISISGIIVTKLDGNSKGGILLSIVDELGLPIHYVGTGESLQDLIPFSYQQYLERIIYQ